MLARTRMKNGSGQLNVPKVTWALRHALPARLALEVPVDSAHPWVHETAHLGFVGGFVHDFGVLDFGDRVCFLIQKLAGDDGVK